MNAFDPFTSEKPLIVYIDYKSPYAFIAKDPTYAIADQLGIEIDWRPLTLDIPSYRSLAYLRGTNPVSLTVVRGEPVVTHMREWGLEV